MLRRALLCTLTLALAAGFTATTPAGAADLPSADSIMEKYIEKTGGKAAYEKLKSLITEGSIEIPAANIKGKTTIYSQAPDKQVNETELEGIGPTKQGYNGEIAWDLNQFTGPRILKGSEKAITVRSATFNSDLKWKDLYKEIKVEAEEKVNDKACYKLVFTPKEGNPEIKFYGKEDGLLHKAMMTVESPMGSLEIESYPSEYKEEDGGIVVPHKIAQKVLGQEFVVKIDKIKANVEIPAGKFDLPEEIKRLAEQEKAAEKKAAEKKDK